MTARHSDCHHADARLPLPLPSEHSDTPTSPSHDHTIHIHPPHPPARASASVEAELPATTAPPTDTAAAAAPAAGLAFMVVLSIEHEGACMYQQFDDTYPAALAPYLPRAAYRHHIHAINAHWRQASLLYLLTLLAFLIFALGPILLGAAANSHNFTGVDEEVGIAMLLVGAVGVVASVLLVRLVSRRMLTAAVEAENAKLAGKTPQLRFRLEHQTMLLPVKRVSDEGQGAVVQAGGATQQQQQQLESSEYRLLLEVGDVAPGTTATLVNAALAEATQLTSLSSHFTLDPTAAVYQPHLCPHCLQDSPPSALPRRSLHPASYSSFPHTTLPLSHPASHPAAHPAVSPLLAAHLLSTLPRSHTQPLPAGLDAIAISIPPPSVSEPIHAAPQPAAAQPAAVTAQ